MASNVPKRREDPIPEVENHLILRVPPHTADDLRKLVNTGNQVLKDKVQIELQADCRHGAVQIDGETFAAKVVDLPCMIESHKTFDRKTFWKTADISQMLLCSTEDEPVVPEEPKPVPAKRPDKVDKKFIWKHGVTPPLRYVRKRRFRKTAKKKYIEAPDVEEEVKRLLRMDSTAIKIRWEVLAEEDIKDDKADSVGSPGNGDILQTMFGDVSSSDENDDEDMDINIEDLEEGTGESPRVLMEGEDSKMTEADDEMEEEEEEDIEDDDEADVDGRQQENELAKRLTEVQQDLVELEGKKKSLEESVAAVDNAMLKQRFQSQLEELLSEMKKKQEEVETLQVIVGNR